jgi:hypothetical protein
VAALAVTLAAGGCGSDGPSPSTTEREARVYAAVIEALAPDGPEPSPETDEPDRVVYAGSLDVDGPIPLEVQAAVVEELVEFATVRFVDEKAEAMEDGVLVLLGAVPNGRSPSVTAERYVDRDDAERFRVSLERSDGDWTVVEMHALGG